MGISNGTVTKWERTTVFTNGTNKFRRYDDKGSFGRIIYHEFRGAGMPTDDIGEPGDIYIDLTPGAYRLYVMKRDWAAYERVPHHIIRGGLGHISDWNKLSHPFLADTYLWVSRRKGVIWATCERIRSDVRYDIVREPLFMHRISTHLEFERLGQKETAGSKRSQPVDGDTSRDSEAKRLRVDEPLNIESSAHSRSIDDTQSGNFSELTHACSAVDRVSRLEADIRTLNDEAAKSLEVKTQLQIEKDKALAESAELQTKLHQAHHDIKTEKVTAHDDIASLRQQLEKTENAKASYHAENVRLQLEIQKLLEEKERWGSEDKDDDLMNQNSIMKSTYLHKDTLDGLSDDAQTVIYAGINMVISVIKDKETALHDAVEEAQKKLADKDVSIHQLSTDVQRHKDTCEQLQRELAEQAENMLTWLQRAPKFNQLRQ